MGCRHHGALAWASFFLLAPATALAQLPFTETFPGADGDPWPAVWTTSASSRAESDIQSGRGRMTSHPARGNGARASRMLLEGLAATDIEAALTLEFEDAARQAIGFLARVSSDTTRPNAPKSRSYGVFLEGAWSGAEALGVWRESDGAEVLLGSSLDPVAGGLQPGVRYRVRVRVTAHAADTTRLQARVWPEGSSEPSIWMVDVLDTALELQGHAGGFAVEGRNYEGKASIFVDDLVIVPVAANVSVPSPGAVPRITLSAPRPHPVAGAARITCALPVAGHATLRLFDAAGRRVADLLDGPLGAGETQLEWRAVDGAGRRLPAGVYLLRLEADGHAAVRRVVVTG